MFGKLGDIAGMLKQAKAMKGRINEMQEQLAVARFDAEVGGGAVKATVTGKLELVDIKIDPGSAGDVDMLEDLIKSAVCAAQAKAGECVKAMMQEMTGGMKLPA